MPYSFAKFSELERLEERVAALEAANAGAPPAGGPPSGEAPEPFYAERFPSVRQAPMMTWDGANGTAIATWLTALSQGSGTTVTVRSESSTELILRYHHAYGVDDEWRVLRNGWVGPNPFGGGTRTIDPNDQAAYWKTNNPHGRPMRAADIEAP